MKQRMGAHEKLGRLLCARAELKKLCSLVPAEVAPQTAKRLRSTLKSLDGAVRHAEHMVYLVREKATGRVVEPKEGA